MGSTEQFNIRWNNYTSVLQNVFRKLLEGEQFVDVTLACEGQSIKCHRVILSACSTYFDRILSDNPTSNLVIYLKDMKFWELRALVTFMYNGEVSISQQKLPHLCKAAEALKVKGLAHDTSLADGDMDRMDDDDMEEFHDGGKDNTATMQQRENRRSPVQGQQKSLLRHHNNLSAFAAAAAAANNNRQQPQQIKRKIMTQPPKLVKMQRVERASNGNGAMGGNVKPQHPIKQLAVKKDSAENMKSHAVAKETFDEEQKTHEVTADSSMKEDNDNGDVEEMQNEEGEAGDENESIGSEGDESQQGQASAGRPSKITYGKEVRDSALTALQSGMTLRQCSETYGVPKKTLSKWKNRESKNEGEEESPSPPRQVFRVKEDGSPSMGNTSGIILPPKTTMGAPVDSADRAERLKKATELALSGVTVRQAAAHYEIPRTTLCAYMKRRGLAAKRNFLPHNNGAASNKRSSNVQIKLENSGETNGQIQGGSSSHYEDFPFLGISELMDEMGQGGYDAEAYADGEEEYTDK